MDLPIVLDRSSNIPLKRQLYDEIRRLILCGQWAPNYKIPSSRALAEKLAISRPVITWAFEQLFNEGYISTFAGSGTFVSRELPEELLHAGKNNIQTAQDNTAVTLPLSRMGDYLDARGKLEDQLGKNVSAPTSRFEIDFRESPPSLERFPMREWKSLLVKHWEADREIMNFHQDPIGYYPLRQAISEYLFKTRAISRSADQIIVVGGAQQALNLIARVHIEPGDHVALDDPSYSGVHYIFQSYGAQVWPIPVDQSGLNIDTLEGFDAIKFKLVYSMPTNQVPLGSTLSLPRRLKLLQWAKKTGTTIVEDYYDGDYRYEGKPIPALAAMDDAGQVLYVGTFSKVLFPSLRLGYLVVPKRLIDVYTWAKKLDDNYSPVLEQLVLADFITGGQFDKYLRMMCKIYKRKRQRLTKALQDYFGELAQFYGDSGGLSLAVRFKTKLTDEVIIKKLAQLGVAIDTTSRNYLAKTHTQGEFVLGYGNLEEDLIEEGVRRMSQVIIRDTKIGQL